MIDKKETLRADMQKVLAALDERWISAASRELCGHLNSLIESKLDATIKYILAWTKFFPGEADLASFIVAQIEDREVYLPRSLPDRSMVFIAVGKEWHLEVETGMFGILEPKDETGKIYDITKAHETAIVIPGIAFDKQGNRLGRGKGYYDRFLSQPEVAGITKIGVCWSLQLTEKVPVSGRDIPMDWICTEEGLVSMDRKR